MVRIEIWGLEVFLGLHSYVQYYLLTHQNLNPVSDFGQFTTGTPVVGLHLLNVRFKFLTKQYSPPSWRGTGNSPNHCHLDMKKKSVKTSGLIFSSAGSPFQSFKKDFKSSNEVHAKKLPNILKQFLHRCSKKSYHYNHHFNEINACLLTFRHTQTRLFFLLYYSSKLSKKKTSIMSHTVKKRQHRFFR